MLIHGIIYKKLCWVYFLTFIWVLAPEVNPHLLDRVAELCDSSIEKGREINFKTCSYFMTEY
jgi:hypothetical protein